MFERNKKDGSDKVQDEWSRQDAPRDIGSPPADAARAAPRSRDVAVIGRSIRIDGDLQGDEDLRIEGDVNGTVQLRNNTLTIGQEGKIRANVYAKSITVDGLMEGDLYGSEQVSIRGNAQVRGNITAPRVSLEDGAKFKGAIEMDPKAVEAALGNSVAVRGKGAQVAAGNKADGGKANGVRPAVNPQSAPVAAAKAPAKNDRL